MKYVMSLLDYAAPYPGNFMLSLYNLEEEMLLRGYRMIYVFMEMNEQAKWMLKLKEDKQNVFFLSRNFNTDLKTIKAIIKKFEVKIVHTHFVGFKYNVLLSICKKFYFKDLILIRHLHNEYIWKSFYHEYIKRKIYSFNLTIGCSEYVAQNYLEHKKSKSEKVVAVVNAIDFSRLDEYELLKKEDYGIPQDAKVFFILGGHYYRKGVDLAINALNLINQQNRNTVFLLISISTEKEFVISEIKKELGGMPQWIRLLDPRNDVATYYKFSDVFLSPSRSEGFCYALVEAAYCGCLLIASDENAQRQLKIPFKIEFQTESTEDFILKIKEALKISLEQKKQIESIEKKYVADTYKIENWAKRICDIYDSYLN